VTQALSIGATFVARSFSGDKHQLVPLIKAGLMHRGFAFIDVVSPCVAFNNHAGSTKSYEYVRGHHGEVVAADLVPPQAEITADYEPGSCEEVVMPDGSTLRLKKLEEDYDPHDLVRTLAYVNEHRLAGEVITGLLYLDPEAAECHEILNTVDTPLNELAEADLCPGSEALESINDSFR